ncbi:MAG TPA: succinylglutamate desuccinylase, partial [Thermopetrobacter sp.]|nr:succinylglutamate desuccinylase [Thermopetrobacter sp.]
MPCERVELPQMPPGLAGGITICRFGRPGARPKAYIQAATHADEVPAMLVAAHLRTQLEAAARADRIRGEIVLVPQANPVGGGQVVLGRHAGRHHLASGRNFNRFWPDATAAVMARRGQFGEDAAANTTLARAIVKGWLTTQHAYGADAALKLLLMRLAHDADYVLDLHTDDEAELHLYVDRDRWPDLSDLAGLLGARVVMLCRASGGNAFEETVAAPFIALDEAGVKVETPATVTVELRGQRDVDDARAARDATALITFLARRGLLHAEAAEREAVPAFTGIAAPFAATEPVRTPVGGIVVFTRQLGATVAAGETIAEIVDPGRGARHVVAPRTSGRLFTRVGHRWVQAGDVIAKVQGTE